MSTKTQTKPGKTENQTWVHVAISSDAHAQLKSQAALAGKKYLPYVAGVLEAAAKPATK